MRRMRSSPFYESNASLSLHVVCIDKIRERCRLQAQLQALARKAAAKKSFIITSELTTGKEGTCRFAKATKLGK